MCSGQNLWLDLMILVVKIMVVMILTITLLTVLLSLSVEVFGGGSESYGGRGDTGDRYGCSPHDSISCGFSGCSLPSDGAHTESNYHTDTGTICTNALQQ